MGTALVATARERAARADCRWLHVDFAPGLRAFHLDACSFRISQDGLLRLDRDGEQGRGA